MIDNSQAWINRANALLNPSQEPLAAEAVQFAISMLTALHGSQSPQLKGFLATMEMIQGQAEGPVNLKHHLLQVARGAIKNAKEELQSGLVVQVRMLVAGEMLAELIRLGKDSLERRTPESKNVAAVLIAAAFEDLIRRMGQEFASVTDRPKLEAVVAALKDVGILKGGQVVTALSYLKFRNDSLHADWEQVDRSQVQSCIGFIEELLVKHFS